MATVLSAPRYSRSALAFNPINVLLAGAAVWRQRRALATLDARGRRDIGLTEGDVARELSKPIWSQLF